MASRTPTRDLIVAALRDGAKTVDQLVECTGLTRSQVHGCLYGSGQWTRTGDIYELRSHSHDPRIHGQYWKDSP